MTPVAFVDNIDHFQATCVYPSPCPLFKMAESLSTESLDYWRKFFNCANADIFQVIKFSILVASVDFPMEFLASRDEITEILYTCWNLQSLKSSAELQTPEEGVVEDDDDDEEEDETSEGSPKESKSSKRTMSEEDNEPTVSNGLSTSNRTPDCGSIDEFEALNDEIEEQQQTLGEVLRIRDVLTNWKEESEKVLSESLRRLQLMELSVEYLSATGIGRAVSGLNKHKSKPIRLLSRTLIKGWKLLANEWVATAAPTPTQETSPVSVNPSPAEEESLLPSELDFPPLDMGALLATQTASFEFSEIFDGMDEDGNPTSAKVVKENGRRLRTTDKGDIQRQEVAARESKPSNGTHKASKDRECPSYRVPEKPMVKVTTYRNTEERKKQSEEVRRQEIVHKPPKPQDAIRKTWKGQDIARLSVPQRPPARVDAQKNTQLRLKPSGALSKPRKDVSKEFEDLAYQRRLEVAKRRLQDRYEEAKNAKKQRTIQVMELKDLPKQGQSQAQNKHQQQLKGKNGSQFRRSLNMRSR